MILMSENNSLYRMGKTERELYNTGIEEIKKIILEIEVSAISTNEMTCRRKNLSLFLDVLKDHNAELMAHES